MGEHYFLNSKPSLDLCIPTVAVDLETRDPLLDFFFSESQSRLQSFLQIAAGDGRRQVLVRKSVPLQGAWAGADHRGDHARDPRRATTSKTSQWYVPLCAARVRSGEGGGRSAAHVRAATCCRRVSLCQAILSAPTTRVDCSSPHTARARRFALPSLCTVHILLMLSAALGVCGEGVGDAQRAHRQPRAARAALPRGSPAPLSRRPRADGARHPPKLSAALLVQEAIARARAFQDVAVWNKTVLTLEGNVKHRLQIGDILDRGSKKQSELGVIIRVAKVTDDSTLAFAPALLWEGKDAVDETTEYTSKLAKWRKQYKHWHKDSARPLQLGFDAILKAIKTACVALSSSCSASSRVAWDRCSAAAVTAGVMPPSPGLEGCSPLRRQAVSCGAAPLPTSCVCERCISLTTFCGARRNAELAKQTVPQVTACVRPLPSC